MDSILRSNHRPALKSFFTCALCVTVLMVLTGCSLPKVQAWDKQHLAKPEMALDADRLEGRYSEHIYFSREGTGGGWSIGGGGCGCN
jgi:hypothetical protein